MRSRDFLLWVSTDDRGRWSLVAGAVIGGAADMGGRRRGRAVRFEDVEAFQLLVQDGERLEFLRLDHLFLEPVLDLVLLLLDEVLVVVVEMSAGLD